MAAERKQNDGLVSYLYNLKTSPVPRIYLSSRDELDYKTKSHP